jgi:phosphoheptose isomerase
MSDTLLTGGTIFTCGEKSGSVIAKLLCDYLTVGFEIERPGFPALNIHDLCSHTSRQDQYSDILNIHANSNDLLVIASAGNDNHQLLKGIESGIEKGMSVVLLSSANDNRLVDAMGYNDVHISVANFSGQLAVLAQFQIVQCLCSLVDDKIFGGS